VGKVIAIISLLFGIPIFLFGALIIGGLSIAGIIGAPNMIPAIIFASILLLTGSFLIFLGWKNISVKRKIVSVSKYDEKYEIINESTKKRSNVAKGLVIVAVIISVATVSVALFWNQLPSDTGTTTTTPSIDNDDPEAIEPPLSGGENAVIMEGNEFQPEVATVSLNDDIVWVNVDPRAHTATSGTGASDPNSGKLFDTGIINEGEKSAPILLKDVRAKDEVEYYCMVHPSMIGKLIIDANQTTVSNSETPPAEN
jgi:plastocyanin